MVSRTYEKNIAMPRKIIVLDYETATAHYHEIDGELHDADEYVYGVLGYKESSVSYMIVQHVVYH